MKLLPVRNTDPEKLPWTKNSIYKFAAEHRYPEIIIKVGGKLFFDMEAFHDLVRKKREAQVKRSRSLFKVKS